VVFEETPEAPYNRGPYLGEQTEEILKNLGYTDEQVAAMIAAGDAAQFAE
jgi:cinnamoyl-CoA:phenyllactate CoA-transferase